MKYMKIIYLTVIAASLMVVQSCTKLENFGDTNQNPNNATEPITSALLTNVLSQLGNTIFINGIATSGALYAQYATETQYTEASRYTKPVWNMDGYYSGPMYDLQNIINYNSNSETAPKAVANGSNANQIATARILLAYYYWIMTDTWGDIPYTEALKGNGLIKYDKQSDVYPALIKELKEAVAQFDGGNPMSGDILYNGNIANWKKFANSMRLLMALRMSKINPTLAQTEFNSALSAGVIQSNSENATLVAPGGVYNHWGYQYYFITQRDDYAVSKTLMDYLNTGDMRVNAYGSSNIGFPYGLTRDNAVAYANANPNYARILNPSKRTPTSPMVIMSASWIYLARAEAAQRGWTNEIVTGPNGMYQLGVQRSWEEWGQSTATLSTYLAQPAYDITGGNALQKIQLQQWIAFFPNGTQGWANWRRTGVPALTPAPGQSAQIVRRVPYGPNDYNFNLANATEAGARYTVGGTADSQDAKVWWDN